MRKTLIAGLLALPLLGMSLSALAADPALGRWKTLDDKTGKAMTISEVYMAKNGMLSARIVENLGLPPNCTECSGEYKDKPYVGIVTLWNLKQQKDGSWGGGNGYKPSEDRHFKAKSVKVVDGGKKMEVTGCIAAFLCRTATWVRAD